ncbi:hypothetical protein FPOA_03860 [Fusarium poae]|uniref:AIG1-type G domain-containing protein n=1 Tax=Fusarium poae TaxID=36050 RepID=A0A1B8ASF9_FUSPO|nr:hypothetical protein FPOA_03860 [Fusarium poae]
MDQEPKNIYVALMGLTGAGKSSFINHCIKQQVVVGDGLQACTETVEVFSFEYSPGVTIHLVDTPGFDDTNRQDSAVLRDISAWLSKSYSEKVLLNGILYLHRISDPRMQGSGKMSIHLLRKLCGKDAFKNVVLVTTMWELVEPDTGNRREKELEETEEFWGFMKRHGSQIRRHQNTEESAREILRMFVPETADIQPEMVALAIQKELADEHKTLDQTGAGQLLDGTWAKEKEALKRELEEVREAVKTANEERDQMMAKLMQDQQNEMNVSVEKIRMEQEKLRVTMEELHQERLSKYQKMLDEQIGISRTLGEDLDEKLKLGEAEREERQAIAMERKGRIQEQETAISELQQRLSESNTTLSTPNTSETDPESEYQQNYEITGLPIRITSLLFNSDGNTRFIGTEKQKIWVYTIGLRDEWSRHQILSCGSRLSRITSSRDDTVDHLFRSHDDADLLAICGSKIFHWKLVPSEREYKVFEQQEWSEYLCTLSLSSDNRHLIYATVGDYNLSTSRTNLGTSSRLSYRSTCHSIRRDKGMAGKGGINCVEFGSGRTFAVGLNMGYVGLFDMIDSTAFVKYRDGFEVPGEVLSIAWISDKRLLVGTKEGVFIRTSEGTIQRMGKQRLEADRECGLVMIDETMGVYGTSTGHFHTCKVNGDRVLPITGRPPVASSFPPDTFSSRREETARFAFGDVGTVTLLTGTCHF